MRHVFSNDTFPYNAPSPTLFKEAATFGGGVAFSTTSTRSRQLSDYIWILFDVICPSLQCRHLHGNYPSISGYFLIPWVTWTSYHDSVLISPHVYKEDNHIHRINQVFSVPHQFILCADQDSYLTDRAHLCSRHTLSSRLPV